MLQLSDLTSSASLRKIGQFKLFLFIAISSFNLSTAVKHLKPFLSRTLSCKAVLTFEFVD